MLTIDGSESQVIDHPFLRGLDPHFIHFFTDCASLRHVNSGDTIFHEGNDANSFYLILKGKVSLETFVPGCGMVTIQTLGAGEALGWSWLFPPQKWLFSASATEPTELIQFDAEWLRFKSEENHDFHCELITRVAQILLARLQGTRMQLIDLYGIRP